MTNSESLWTTPASRYDSNAKLYVSMVPRYKLKIIFRTIWTLTLRSDADHEWVERISPPGIKYEYDLSAQPLQVTLYIGKKDQARLNKWMETIDKVLSQYGPAGPDSLHYAPWDRQSENAFVNIIKGYDISPEMGMELVLLAQRWLPEWPSMKVTYMEFAQQVRTTVGESEGLEATLEEEFPALMRWVRECAGREKKGGGDETHGQTDDNAQSL